MLGESSSCANCVGPIPAASPPPSSSGATAAAPPIAASSAASVLSYSTPAVCSSRSRAASAGVSRPPPSSSSSLPPRGSSGPAARPCCSARTKARNSALRIRPLGAYCWKDASISFCEVASFSSIQCTCWALSSPSVGGVRHTASGAVSLVWRSAATSASSAREMLAQSSRLLRSDQRRKVGSVVGSRLRVRLSMATRAVARTISMHERDHAKCASSFGPSGAVAQSAFSAWSHASAFTAGMVMYSHRPLPKAHP